MMDPVIVCIAVINNNNNWFILMLGDCVCVVLCV